MKKLLCTLLTLALFLMLAGCAEEVSRQAIDVRYTPAHEGVETNYVHKYDWYSGGFVMVPEVRTVHYEEKYSILYEITYDDGSTATRWQDCAYSEYIATQKQLQNTTE